MRVPLASLLALGVLSAIGGPASAASAPARGVSFVGHTVGAYSGPAPVRAMSDLASTGAGWVSIVVTGYQSTFDATSIASSSKTPSDSGVAHMIDAAHALGLAVMVKPHIDLSHDPAHWRGDIGHRFDRSQRRAWFASYRTFVDHYAALAQSHGAEEFSVGCELQGTTSRASAWRRVVAGVRRRFSGTLTYAAWPGEEQHIGWWDALDLIGVDAYYPLTASRDPDLADLVAGWQPHIAELGALSTTWHRPVLLTEIGYVSQDGTNTAPSSWKVGPIDLQEQADCYEAAFEALWHQPWLAGMFWWNWSADPSVGGVQNTGFTPFGKPAEGVLRAWYA
jgi:Glycoside Hydrolase Family 113